MVDIADAYRVENLANPTAWNCPYPIMRPDAYKPTTVSQVYMAHSGRANIAFVDGHAEAVEPGALRPKVTTGFTEGDITHWVWTGGDNKGDRVNFKAYMSANKVVNTL